MRCPDCNKFVAYDDADPEVQNLEIGDDGAVTASVTRTLTCAECGTELKSAELELTADPLDEVTEHLKAKGPHELSVAEDGVEPTSRTDGKGRPARYTRTYYGVELGYTVTCSCDDKWEAGGSMDDDVQASDMDELV